MHFYKILLVSPPGKGKTYSARNLDRNSTGMINVEDKPFPFSGDFRLEAKPNTTEECLTYLRSLSTNNTIDSGFFDSLSAYSDFALKEGRATKKGYEIFNYYNERIADFHQALKKVEKDVFVTIHMELVFDEVAGIKERRAKVVGKQWEGLVEKEYTIVLYAIQKPNPDPKKRPTHHFQLVDVSGSAKCPPEIFGEDIIEIPNDSRFVLDKIKEFRAKKPV